jgi:hypothetical protein
MAVYKISGPVKDESGKTVGDFNGSVNITRRHRLIHRSLLLTAAVELGSRRTTCGPTAGLSQLLMCRNRVI